MFRPGGDASDRDRESLRHPLADDAIESQYWQPPADDTTSSVSCSASTSSASPSRSARCAAYAADQDADSTAVGLG